MFVINTYDLGIACASLTASTSPVKQTVSENISKNNQNILKLERTLNSKTMREIQRLKPEQVKNR